MGLENRRVFTKKPYSKFLYKWTPFDEKGKANKKKSEKPFFCDATPNSQGQDFITTYVYNQVNDNGKIKRFAYVTCDYVQ